MRNKLCLCVAATAVAIMSLGGCGDDDKNTTLIVQQPAQTRGYAQTNLASNIPGLAGTTVPNLVNSWGIAHTNSGAWWVNNNGTGTSNVYTFVKPFTTISTSRVVTIPTVTSAPSTPTGIVFNNFSGFRVNGTASSFIFVTEDGTISAWNGSAGSSAVLEVNNFAGGTGAVYKGAALATNGSANFLYVANFRAGTVEVYDSTFTPVTMPAGAFTVPAPRVGPPAGYAPFNIANIGGKLYVAFAQQDSAGHDDVPGQGHGFVEVFNPDGSFVMSLQGGVWLNSPWGMTKAPAGFGALSNAVLVGNFGSGQIAAFDPATGLFKDLMRDQANAPIFISGLWGLGFGNGGAAGPTTTLFFAAGLNGESDGLFGTLTPAAQ